LPGNRPGSDCRLIAVRSRIVFFRARIVADELDAGGELEDPRPETARSVKIIIRVIRRLDLYRPQDLAARENREDDLEGRDRDPARYGPHYLGALGVNEFRFNVPLAK